MAGYNWERGNSNNAEAEAMSRHWRGLVGRGLPPTNRAIRRFARKFGLWLTCNDNGRPEDGPGLDAALESYALAERQILPPWVCELKQSATALSGGAKRHVQKASHFTHDLDVAISWLEEKLSRTETDTTSYRSKREAIEWLRTFLRPDSTGRVI